MLVDAAGEIEAEQPLFCEVGVWKGAGVIDMARSNPKAQVLAVDTFRGSAEHWLREAWQPFIRSNRLYRQFLSNMVACRLEEMVTPLPLDSINAAHVCAKLGLVFDLTHIDAGHDYESVMLDLRHWCGLSRKMVIDDYCSDWPEVVAAVDKFCEVTNWYIVEHEDGKCLLEYDNA